MLPLVPMRLAQVPRPFDSPDHLFEIKWDGFRALAHIQSGRTRLFSRRQHEYRTFAPLCADLAEELTRADVILDGEIVCLDSEGKPDFYDLLRRRGTPQFYAFDVLSLDGRDLRALPLIERKQLLRDLIPPSTRSLLYSGHIEGTGVALFEQVCRHDMEGIVAKVRTGRYICGPTAATLWTKIKNPLYSQLAGRDELFDRSTRRAATR